MGEGGDGAQFQFHYSGASNFPSLGLSFPLGSMWLRIPNMLGLLGRADEARM